MDIFINTLTGACFELRVSPFEPIFSIKCKLERLEEIPVSQQHIVWQSIELEDDKCLHDYGIKSGANLSLVLAMKNGLINTRKVVMEDPSLEGLDVYVDESTKQEVLDKLMKDEKQVTFLVYREGDQLNFFRVQEKEVSTSPLSDDDRYSPGKQMENFVTKDKMRLLRQQMAAKNMKKGTVVMQIPQPVEEYSSDAQCSIEPPRHTISQGSVTQYCQTPKTDSSLSMFMSNMNLTPSPSTRFEADDIPTPDLQNRTPHLPLICKGGITDVNDPDLKKGGSSSSNKSRTKPSPSTSKTSNSSITPNQYKKSVSSKLEKGIAQSSSKNTLYKKDFRKSSRAKRKKTKTKSVDRNTSNSSLSEKKTPISSAGIAERSTHCSFPELEPLSSSHKRHTNSATENVCLPNIHKDNLDNQDGVFDWIQESKEDSFEKGSRLRTVASHHNSHLPPLSGKIGNTLPKINSKSKLRCSSCRKKLGLATTYQCRCGNTFCPKHRYPEAHSCSYDYKTEGRKLLEQNNPVVRAQKLPKI